MTNSLASFDTALAAYIRNCKADKMSPGTVENYERVCNLFRRSMVANGFTEASIPSVMAWKSELADKGVKIHAPSAAEQKMFREAAQPAALEIISKRIGKEWVEGAVKAADEASKKVAGKDQQMMDECIRQAKEMVKVARAK